AAWIGGHQQLTLLASPARKLYSAPGEPESAFRARLALAMREESDSALAKIQGKYATRIAALQDKVRRAEQAVDREREQARAQQMNAALSVGADLLGAFFGRRKMVTAAGSAMRGVGRAARGSGDASRAEENFAAAQAQLQTLEEQLTVELHEIGSRYSADHEPVDEHAVKPKKTNVQVKLFTLAWVPYRRENGSLTPAWS
ncbi:MAG TPA: hypothetical protein VES20_23840, partial [Bryobacteraceae bacterium]|nr:hypothetical protein [Bryobacteraceae bacterium]